MPRRKTSYETRRRDVRKALNKYREKNGDFDRERNKKMLALRRKDEDYHFEELHKNRISQQKLRYYKKRKEIAYIRAKEAYLARQEAYFARQEDTKFGITKRNEEAYLAGQEETKFGITERYEEAYLAKQEETKFRITERIEDNPVYNECYREDELSYSIVNTYFGITKRNEDIPLYVEIKQEDMPTYEYNEHCHFSKMESSQSEINSTIEQFNTNKPQEEITERNEDIPMYMEIKQEDMPGYNEYYREDKDKLSYSITNTYEDNEHCHFPKLESSHREQLNKPHPIEICKSNAEFCIPIPIKKSI